MNQNVDNITIIADDRECKSEVIKSLSEKKDITVEVKRLLKGTVTNPKINGKSSFSFYKGCRELALREQLDS